MQRERVATLLRGVLLKLRCQLCLGNGAEDLIHDLAILEEQNERNGTNAEALRQTLVLIHIYLRYLGLTGVLGSKLIKEWTNHTAWSTPGSPEIHNCKAVVLLDLAREGGVRKLH